MNKFTIITDTRETYPWDFSFYKECKAELKQALKEGDYTIKELLDLEEKTGEKILRVERKANTGEIYMNLGKFKKRFFNEMERLRDYKYKYIICEFEEHKLYQFPVGSNIPKNRWQYLKINGKFLRKSLYEIEEKYDVPTIFCKDKNEATEKALEIFNMVYNGYKEEISK